MKNSFLHLLFAMLVLVAAAGAEEMLPKVGSVGVPLLLVAVQVLACRWPALPAVLFAVAAGAMEEALSSLPVMTGVSSFLSMAVGVRFFGLPMGLMALSYPLFQLWLLVWVPSLSGNAFHRLLIALPVGVATDVVFGFAVAWLERRVALDEAD